MIVLITGVAGFIGFHLASKLIDDGVFVIGIDNLNDYYDVSLKEARLEKLRNLAKTKKSQFLFHKIDLENYQEIIKTFENYSPTHVVNLAAQAGVRYSIENPSAYIKSNLVGFSNILEACRKNKIKHLVFASSSSVYGGNDNFPFSEKQGVDHPVSLYAATKRSNELIAHTYSHLYSIPSTGLRFFTVYGPWGRPDMALFNFTKNIIEGNPIEVFNNGKMFRSFTYIDDIIEALSRILIKPPSENKSFNINYANPSISWAPFRIFNIGNSESKSLMEYIKELEVCLGLNAKKIFLDMHLGDVARTAAETSLLEEYISYKPKTNIKEGIKCFVSWYKMFYGI